MDTYIIAAARSPRGRGNAKSSLKGLTPIALATQVLHHLLSGSLSGPLSAPGSIPMSAIPSAEKPKAPLPAVALDDLLIGCATQFGEQGSNLARLIGIATGLSDEVPAATINRACCSGLSAVIMAALKVQAGAGMQGVAVAGGVEMMSRVALASDQGSLFFDHAFNREYGIVPLGIAADAIASQFGFTREACDAYAVRSQQRALAAREHGHFRGIVPIVGAKGELLLDQDENIRPGNTAEYLATLAPAFAELGRQSGGGKQSPEQNPQQNPQQNPEQTSSYDAQIAARLGLDGVNHVHHAGNSPIAADAAAFVLLANSEAVKRHQWQPRARIVAFAECGINRSLALTGAVEASRKALANAKLRVADIDLFEVNEAFAATMLQYAEAMQIGFERLNVNGGTLAFGHAMGATGAILLAMALEELERRQARYALVAISGAAGLASAVIIERIV